MKIYAFADEASKQVDLQIKTMLENGILGMEARNIDGVNVSDISDHKAREVRKKLDDAGLVTWSVGSPIGKIDIVKDKWEPHLEKLRRTMEIADILGAKQIRLFSFFIPKGEDPADYKNEVIHRMGQFCRIAEGSGIDLCHENEKGIYGDIPRRCLEIHQALPELHAVFDPANFVQCGVDTQKAWEMLSGYVKYLHIKDALADGSIVPPGKGIGNLAYILEAYRKQGGECLTLEPHLKVFDGLKALEQEGDTSVVGAVYRYPTNEAAFQAAADALKELIGG